MIDIDAGYVTDEAAGDGWRLLLGDACERLSELDTASVDLSICSPPFAQLYNYSPSPRDLSNSKDRARVGPRRRHRQGMSHAAHP